MIRKILKLSNEEIAEILNNPEGVRNIKVKNDTEIVEVGKVCGLKYVITRIECGDALTKELRNKGVDEPGWWTCGYVEVPKDFKGYGAESTDEFDGIECIGGITWAGPHPFLDDGIYYVGFDTRHPFVPAACKTIETARQYCLDIALQLWERERGRDINDRFKKD